MKGGKNTTPRYSSSHWRPRPASCAPAKSEIALQRVNKFIDENIAQPITIPQIAREAGLSQNYLARLFQQRYGMTIPRYLLTRRTERARHLLATSNDFVKQIAAAVGMPDPQHFNKQFRRLAGSSPSEFRLKASQDTGRYE